MSIIKLTGQDAIEYAEAFDAPLRKHADPVEDARDDLTPDEAREVASEDPGLIYISLELDESCDPVSPGKMVRVVSVEQDEELDGYGIFRAGVHLVAMPESYDPEGITAEDIIRDGAMRTVMAWVVEGNA